ncbi:MAG: insulinase family protein [Gemmatimonadetes bacterium]|nr:insulinase family protein [Gemmatimonadota bacterium]
MSVMPRTRFPALLAVLAAGLAHHAGGVAPRALEAAAAPVAPELRPQEGRRQEQRKKAEPPAALAPKPVSFPAYHERKLASGAQVIVVENHEQPVVRIDLRIRGGSAVDPRDVVGTSDLTAELLNKGTKTRTARQLAEAIDFVGGSLGAGAGTDWMSVSATALTEFLDTALVLLSDIVLNPTFPDEELEIARQRMLSALQLELSQPEALAERRFLTEVYGTHPYGKLPTPESLKAIKRADVGEFHRAIFRPGNALFVVAGDVSPDDVVMRLDRHFSGWASGSARPPTYFAPPARERREVVLIHKPGSVQAVIRVGHLIPPATYAAWPTLDVLRQILGGSSTGWLFKVLREEKGFTYGAYATTAARVDRGYFQAWAEVRNEVTDSAMTELFRLLRRIREEPVPAADLKLAKDFMTGSFPITVETPQQVAGQVATTRLLGRPADYLQSYRDRVVAVSAEDVQRVARELVDADRAIVVVVGDATQIRQKLGAFGPIRMFDVEGKPVALADIEVRAAEIAFDASGLRPRILVYSLVVQGNPMGEITATVSRERLEGRDVVRMASTGGGMGLTMKSQVAFDARTFTPIFSQMEQRAGPMRMATELRYEGGRITGSVTEPQGQTKTVDASVVAGTILPGMDDAVVELADFVKTKELKLPAFNPRSGTAYTLTIKVTGESRIKVSAGEFEVYELEVSGAEGRQRIYARKEAPHVMVKQESYGQPVVIELKEIR